MIGMTKMSNLGFRRAVCLLITAMMLAGICLSGSAETIGPVTITLHLHRYYEHWGDDGLTMLGYKVKSEDRFPVDAWVLGLEECFGTEDILWWSVFEWVEDPIHGLQFLPATKTEIFYFYVAGPTEMGSVPVVVIDDGALYYGACEGPVCGASSVSLTVVSGADVTFPPVTGEGRFDALQQTVLRVSSLSAGWTLDHDIDVTIPEGADEQTVRNIFRVLLAQESGSAGMSEIDVSYALEIEGEDFNGLPQGSYVVSITYTLSADL